MKVSVILPTYNESGNIVSLVHAILANIPSEYEAEILVVDDNSPDGTYQLVMDQLGNHPSVVPILRTTDRGFAKSIRAGIEGATGDQLIIMDTDFTHDPKEIPKLLHVAQVYDIASGSRFCPGGAMQSTRHYIASRIFNEWVRLLLRTQIQDNLGGFFTISARKLRKLPFDLIFFGYGEYFFRLLHFAEREGFSIVEIPAIYASRKSGVSKSKFLKMIFSYSYAMIKLKWKSTKYQRIKRQLAPESLP